jgi:hypothetical protein
MRALALAFTLLTSLAAHAALPTPTEAITLALTKPLSYVGKYVSPLSASGLEHCIFRNEDVTVLYKYCMKDEAPAVSMVFFPKGSEVAIDLYAEGMMNASLITRDFYFDTLWRVSLTKTAASFSHDMPAEAFGPYEVETDRDLGCVVMYMEQLGEIVRCFEQGTIELEAGAEWLVTAKEFWDKPSDNWYELQLLMRAKIAELP